MNIQVILDSRYGNGRQVAEYLAANLIANGHSATMHLAKESKPEKIPLADIYIFVAPTHARRASRRIRRFIKKMDFPPKARYVSITTYTSKTFAVPGMNEMLDNKGITHAHRGLEIRLEDGKGPIEAGWEKKVDSVIKNIAG